MSLIELPPECRSELLTGCPEGDLYGESFADVEQAIVPSSTIFISTATNVLGFFIFLGPAQSVL